VQSGPLLRSLFERGLIKIVGRLNVPGRPILYGTSRQFLRHFGLKSLKDLPRVAELSPP
jgi:segregation and condensation protein B